MIKSFAELKRTLKVGMTLTMTRNDWYPSNGLIGRRRKIAKVQGNGIAFRNGGEDGDDLSWFFWDGHKAADFKFTEDGFMVRMNPDRDEWMAYRIEAD